MSGPGAAVLSFPSPPLPFTPFWGTSPWACRRPPRLLGGTPGVLGAPSPPQPPRAAGPGGTRGAGRRLRPEETLPKQNIIELSDRDCPGTSGPGRAEATACRDSGRGKNGERGHRRRLYPGSAEETPVVAWWSDA